MGFGWSSFRLIFVAQRVEIPACVAGNVISCFARRSHGQCSRRGEDIRGSGRGLGKGRRGRGTTWAPRSLRGREYCICGFAPRSPLRRRRTPLAVVEENASHVFLKINPQVPTISLSMILFSVLCSLLSSTTGSISLSCDVDVTRCKTISGITFLFLKVSSLKVEENVKKKFAAKYLER